MVTVSVSFSEEDILASKFFPVLCPISQCFGCLNVSDASIFQIKFRLPEFVQSPDVDQNPRGAKGDSGLLSRPELEQMISWETNNLYEYLKELYDHKHEDSIDDRYVV